MSFVGRSISRHHLQLWYCQMDPSQRGPGPRQHLLLPGPQRHEVPHHGLQLASGEDPGRHPRPTGYANWPGLGMFRLLEG